MLNSPMEESAHNLNETIVALATPRGYSGIGVIRLSGPDTVPILKKIFRFNGADFPDRKAVYGEIVNPVNDSALDDGIAVVMRGPSSYTGEDVAELSLHGSPVILDAAVRMITELGARLATRGEFTRRAFLSGRIDLVQAEAVIDLIESRSQTAVEQARSRLDRTLSKEVDEISNALKDILAELEAYIDFDEDDVEPAPEMETPLREVFGKMEKLRNNSEKGRISRDGANTVISGKPNVGKSTLFNALMGIDRMIVTPHPGTTRDPVDDYLLLEGMSFRLWDTAGIREDAEAVEEEGIRRSRARLEDADVILAVLDGSATPDEQDAAVLEAGRGREMIVVLNKTDLGLAIDPKVQPPGSEGVPFVAISAKTGEGVESLERLLVEIGGKLTKGDDKGSVASLNSRCLMLMEAASIPLKSLLNSFEQGEKIEPEIASVELRRALGSLEEITGERVDEGILDRIFERFCVGK
jgi:tRNA modification GTPase